MSAKKRRERKAAAILRDQHPDTAIASDLRATVERLTKRVAEVEQDRDTWAHSAQMNRALINRVKDVMPDPLINDGDFDTAVRATYGRIATLEAANAELTQRLSGTEASLIHAENEAKSLKTRAELAEASLAERDLEREICICAAVIDPITREIVRGHRHAGPMSQIWNRYEPPPRITQEHQGFITSRNRFVGREEGLQIQKAAGIESACKDRGYLDSELTSEDLYAGEY